MAYNPQNPLIVQGDKTVLLEVDNALYEQARDVLSRFAELEKSPEYVHTYRVTPLSLWNAAAAGMSAEAIIQGLSDHSKYPLPDNVRVDILDFISRYGRVKLIREDGQLLLVSDDVPLIAELVRHKRLIPYILTQRDPRTLVVNPARRGHIKQALTLIGYPAADLAGYVTGSLLQFSLRRMTKGSKAFSLRHYQQEAVDIFHAGGAAHGGSGVVVLPCGAGKTMVGMGVMEKLQCNTLILSPHTVAVRQWIAELLDKTSLTEEMIGEYSGLRKEVRPVTITTYQIMTYRPRRKRGSLPPEQEFPHFALFDKRDWGLIIYDEVHLLPAPVFRVTAEIQALRRLGLTATLVREDGRESDVFSLIGPKKYDVPWKDLEKHGWIAAADCCEIRVSMSDEDRLAYAVAERRSKYRIAAENPRKLVILDQLLAKHKGDNVLIMGMYLDQLRVIAERYDGTPIITGKTSIREREKLFDQFRRGELKTLIVSKVANFALDLPDANVAVQVSGTFGSRQEEAQRLGRILRPKEKGQLAHFYSVVSRDTRDQEFAANRQLFLTEQGYRYLILYEDEVEEYEPGVSCTQWPICGH